VGVLSEIDIKEREVIRHGDGVGSGGAGEGKGMRFPEKEDTTPARRRETSARDAVMSREALYGHEGRQVRRDP